MRIEQNTIQTLVNKIKLTGKQTFSPAHQQIYQGTFTPENDDNLQMLQVYTKLIATCLKKPGLKRNKQLLAAYSYLQQIINFIYDHSASSIDSGSHHRNRYYYFDIYKTRATNEFNTFIRNLAIPPALTQDTFLAALFERVSPTTPKEKLIKFSDEPLIIGIPSCTAFMIFVSAIISGACDTANKFIPAITSLFGSAAGAWAVLGLIVAGVVGTVIAISLIIGLYANRCHSRNTALNTAFSQHLEPQDNTVPTAQRYTINGQSILTAETVTDAHPNNTETEVVIGIAV